MDMEDRNTSLGFAWPGWVGKSSQNINPSGGFHADFTESQQLQVPGWTL